MTRTVASPGSGQPEAALVAAARRGDEEAFRRLSEPYRRELHVHCYRMLGSLHDAEDAVQETLLRAWRRLGRFEGRGPFRAWLYKIATNACLTALARRRRAAPKNEASEMAALAPYPDRLLDELEPAAGGPEAQYELGESVELAFLAAIQLLPPRQRAVLLLRDVLGWSAGEAAELLGASVAGVNSALQRARATLEHERAAGRLPPAHAPASAEVEQRLLRRYVEAWQAVDIEGLVALLAEDALLTMPPLPFRYEGREAIGVFLSTVPAGGRLDRIRLVPTRANRQPALAAYVEDPADGVYRAYGIMVFAIAGETIAAITGFADPTLSGRFGLPGILEQ